VCLNQQGKLLHHETIYRFFRMEKRKRGQRRSGGFVNVSALRPSAVGNGTGRAGDRNLCPETRSAGEDPGGAGK